MSSDDIISRQIHAERHQGKAKFRPTDRECQLIGCHQATSPVFIEFRPFDFNGRLGKDADGQIWYVPTDLPAYICSSRLWNE